MDITQMYSIINKKGNSFKDFITFIDFMFDNRNKVNELKCKKDRENFDYHFDRMPIYTREILSKLRYDLIEGVANIGATTENMSKRIDEFTKL
ncbi:MAG TPA: hypothetical protein GX526_01070 [Thermoanaerobacterales bacterium]|nr:hypothetical protein [Thermoanaerobacterales bacterium]